MARHIAKSREGQRSRRLRERAAQQRVRPCPLTVFVDGSELARTLFTSAELVRAPVDSAFQFRSGQDFSAWIGVVPKQNLNGGKDGLGSISKRGDRYLRVRRRRAG